MAQSDYELAAHISGLNQRIEINSIFDSILTHNSGSTAPTVTKAFMMWVDTSNATYYYLKMRNHDNTAWVTLFIYTVSTKVITPFIVNSPTTNALAKIQADGTIKNSSVIEDVNGKISITGTNGLATTLATSVTNAGASVNSDTASGTNGLYVGKTTGGVQYLQNSNSAGTTAYNIALNPYGGNIIVGSTGTSSGRLSSIVSSLEQNMLFCGYGSTGVLSVYAGSGGITALNYVQDSVVYVGKATNTNRSINAVGSINASGADYAEYEYSNDITLVKGQIVGFKYDGTLTDKYSESIRFAIKSTNPCMVGGDTWALEEKVGKKPIKPVIKLDITEQKLIKDAVLGDNGTILEDAVYETVIIEKGDSDKEWELIYSTYEKDLADFENRLETERQKVDRIAYAGKVPVNVYGAKAGQYIIASNKDDSIIGIAVDSPTFEQYLKCVGRVNKILDDGRCEVAVIIH